MQYQVHCDGPQDVCVAGQSGKCRPKIHTTAAPLTSPASIFCGSNARKHLASFWLSHAVPRKLGEVVDMFPELRLAHVVVIDRV
jgi:hypothetical protein